MRFAIGGRTGRSAHGSSEQRAYVELQWKEYRARLELMEAQAELARVRWQLAEVRLLAETLRANEALMDGMSDADQMVIKHVLEVTS